MLGTPFAVDLSCDDQVWFTNKAVSSDTKNWKDASDLKMIEAKALGFDSAQQTFFTAGPSAYTPERSVLQPWYGYWLLVDRADELSITFKNTAQK
jgi:hypothetical protein